MTNNQAPLIIGGLAGLSIPLAIVAAFFLYDGGEPAPVSAEEPAAAECDMPEPIPAPSTNELATTASPSALTPEPPRPAEARPTVERVERGPVRVRRLIVARGVEAHEPTGASDELRAAPGERLYAFVDAVNRTDDPVTLTVTFEPADGETTGHVGLDVPADVGRYRTWAYTRNAERPGDWDAVVRAPDGRVLARRSFEITE